MDGPTTALPLYVARESGAVDRLGDWVPAERRLVLGAHGFPFLGPGDHAVEGDLPWIFRDLCPSGFLGRRLSRQRPALALGPDPRQWAARDVTRALVEAGSDLAGNLLVGEQAVREFRAWQGAPRELEALLEETLSDAMTAADASSLGGERPKFLGSSPDGAGYLVKFSPPATTPQGERWADLLRMEAHCARVLAGFGVAAARSEVTTSSGRTILRVERFDRLPGRGRVGAATLFWLTMERLGDVRAPAPEVLRGLAAEGLVPAADVETCERVHLFSAAIGNTDAHLGNYGLLFDAEGRARLSPTYDVLPMVLAPRHDELPDAHLVPRSAPIDPRVAAWVHGLVDIVMADEAISPGFRDAWLRHVGLSSG